MDWNGTVVADRERALGATNTVLERLGMAAISPETFQWSFALPLSQFFARLGVADRSLNEAQREWNDACIEQPAPLASGAKVLLGACRARKVPVGVITAADPALVGADSGRLDVRHLLTWVAGNVSDKRAELIRSATRRHQAVYVGDTVDDIRQAHEAGILAVGVTGGYHSRAQLETVTPDLIIDDLSDLLPLLDGATIAVTDQRPATPL